MSKQLLPIMIRSAKASDLGFVLNRWKHSTRKLNPKLTRGQHFDLMNLIADEILVGCPAVFVACTPDDEDVLLGFVVAEATPARLVLWIAFVEDGYREQKIASRLIAHAFDKLDDAGPETTYCVAHSKLDGWLQTRLGAGYLTYKTALRLRGTSA